MRSVFATLALLMTVGASHAQQSNNSLFVTQTGDGNVLSVDQSTAVQSTIGSPSSPITQAGALNQLSIADAGTGNSLSTISQDNSDAILAGNLASITLGQGAVGTEVSLTQGALANPGSATLSGDNIAAINVTLGASAAIAQRGQGNRAALTLAGDGASGAVVQQGSNNSGALTVAGVGANATLTQTGVGLNSAGVDASTDFTSGAPVGIQVLTNGATVQISQSN